MFNIGVVLEEDPDEQFEAACAEVANLLDHDDWKWLRARIADEHSAWPAIMDLVAAHI